MRVTPKRRSPNPRQRHEDILLKQHDHAARKRPDGIHAGRRCVRVCVRVRGWLPETLTPSWSISCHQNPPMGSTCEGELCVSPPLAINAHAGSTGKTRFQDGSQTSKTGCTWVYDGQFQTRNNDSNHARFSGVTFWISAVIVACRATE
jgi:hypothetical protein